ncbi:MAG: histidinol-phosphate transaminase [Eubacteriaceae bacterium]|uniref:Histidinol-phosphate aminotransferase n=1 Tax=Candidatus Pseudoramibacter fermentans TaxID=2594427 RepID=A0A6L5GRA9_9FIRM|nr:histidinol-phosphate transaminase [Candidatus Pseudoramibacter fermentans]RRF92884.1 MAG: histidinol-phosphate transaminase [Eubacteriaceae bacterium]
MTPDFTRLCVKDLEAYKVVPPNYNIIVNANENPFDFPDALKKELNDEIMRMPLNRYPDPSATALREQLADYTGIDADQIICGCGSDEIMSMLNQTFINPGDVVISHAPSFSMYQIWSVIGGADFIWVPDNDDLYPDVENIINTAKLKNAKLIYLCSPNNPTGSLLPRHDVIDILEETNALVILDEAYIEFKKEGDLTDIVNEYNNVIVLRTLSKAFGLAGIRCGYAVGPKPLIDMMYKVKSPYNLNKLTQAAAVIALKHRDTLLKNVDVINSERQRLYEFLKGLKGVTRVYPTASNFIYFEVPDGAPLYDALLDEGILVKYLKHDVSDDVDHIRLTVGSPEENDAVIKVLKRSLS